MAFAALGIIWGLPYFFIKLAVQEVSPLILAFSRVVLAAVILIPIAWRRGALGSLGNHKLAIVAFGLVEFAIPFSLISFGERWISSSVTGILIAMVPLSIALIQRFFGIREALGIWLIFGLVAGFIGVAALLGTGSISGSLGWAGVGCMLLATLCYAIGPLIIQRHMHGLDSIGPLAASLSVAALILLIPAAMDFPSRWPSSVALLSIAVLGTVCTAVAMLLMFYLVRHAGASRASVITYINPVVAALLGVWVLDEHLGIGGFIAFALILLGSWLAARGSAARSSSSAGTTVSV
ncbi:MAG TPA: DMT family transporter [Steroidobacteraceae bacterium]|jgi:drug/metabolite transporter (DMT)-like permease|nr:DMT family transporter [Steroidobacteraceae bacterium]